jgi:hypothetical protein
VDETGLHRPVDLLQILCKDRGRQESLTAGQRDLVILGNKNCDNSLPRGFVVPLVRMIVILRTATHSCVIVILMQVAIHTELELFSIDLASEVGAVSL